MQSSSVLHKDLYWHLSPLYNLWHVQPPEHKYHATDVLHKRDGTKTRQWSCTIIISYRSQGYHEHRRGSWFLQGWLETRHCRIWTGRLVPTLWPSILIELNKLEQKSFNSYIIFLKSLKRNFRKELYIQVYENFVCLNANTDQSNYNLKKIDSEPV